MNHKESIIYHKDNEKDIMLIKRYMNLNNFKHDYNVQPVNLDKGIWQAEFILDETRDRLQYIVTGIRRKLESLNYY